MPFINKFQHSMQELRFRINVRVQWGKMNREDVVYMDNGILHSFKG